MASSFRAADQRAAEVVHFKSVVIVFRQGITFMINFPVPLDLVLVEVILLQDVYSASLIYCSIIYAYLTYLYHRLSHSL